MKYSYNFGFFDSVIAQIGGVTLNQLHFDAGAIAEAYGRMKPLAERLGVPAPRPKMAGFGYPHIAALGAEVDFPENSEPKPRKLLKNIEDIDNLTEPEDYLSAPLIQKKLSVLKELKEICPGAPDSIGHTLQGPVTTAVLLLGESFFTLIYDDPKKAHKLMAFCTESALNYKEAIRSYFGHETPPGPRSLPDDFAGMLSPPLFREFVAPYWEKIYGGLNATERHLHSELLRKDHLPFLKELGIKIYDPSADQYLAPEILEEHCPCGFTLRIQSWDIHNLSPDELEDLYIKLQSHKPVSVSFFMSELSDEEKIKRLLNTAKKMEK